MVKKSTIIKVSDVTFERKNGTCGLVFTFPIISDSNSDITSVICIYIVC